MANYNSILQNFGDVKSPVDVDFMGKVLMAKQGAFDAGLAAVDESLAAMKQQENILIRPEDKARLSGNIQTLLNTVNSSGKLDLSSKNVTRTIKNQIGTALDDYTVTQIGNSQKIRGFQAEIEEKRKKNDGSYADQNVMYAQDNSQLKDYLAGNTDTIGNLTYTNYTDYRKELKNIADNLDKYDHDVKKQFRGSGENEGYFVTKEGKELTAQELKAKTELLLSDGAKKQMQIDGYASYDRGATEEEKFANVKSKFTEFRTTLEKEDKEELDTYRGLLNNEPNNKDYIAKVDALTKRVNTTKTTFDDIEKSKSAMYTTMFTESTIRNFANTFAINDISTVLSTDTGYWHEKDLEYKKNKDLLATQAKTKSNLNDVQEKFTPAPLGEQSSAYDQQQETITALQTTVDSKANEIYASLPQATRNSVDNLVKASKGKLTRDGAIVEVIGKSSELVKLSDIMALDESRNALLNEKTAFSKYVKQVSDEASKSIDNLQFVKAMYDNPNIKVLWKSGDGVERMYPAKDLLAKVGVSVKDGKMVGNISAHPELLKAFNNSIIADKTLSSTQTFDYKNNLKRLATSLGEDIDAITIKGAPTYSNYTGSMGAPMGGTSQVETIDPKSKTGRFLEAHKKGGGYNRDGIFSADDSFDDVGSETGINNFLDFDIKSKVDRLLSEDRTLAMNKSFMITPNTDMFKYVARQVGDDLISNKDTSIKLSLIAGQPNMVRVSQLQKGEQGTVDTKIADLRMQDLPPEALQKINFQNTKQAITVANSEHIKSKVKYTDVNDINRVLDLQETVLSASPDMAYLTMKENIEALIFNNTTTGIVGTQKQPTQIGTVVQKVLNDPNIQVAVVPSGTRYFVEISRQVGDKNTVIVRTPDQVDDTNIESVYKMVKYAPQTYVANILMEMVKQEGLKGNTPVLKTLTEIYGK